MSVTTNIEKNLPVYPDEIPGDYEHVLQSLGSFWNLIFQDKQALRGYSMAWAEQTTQAYLDLLDQLNSMSVSGVQAFSKEKWKPIFIKESEYRKIPFVFEKDGAVFGEQVDQRYLGQVFKFGEPKETDGNVYAFQVPKELVGVSVICEKITVPKSINTYTKDFYIKDGVCYFNFDIFNSADVHPVTVKTSTGTDRLLVLWACNADIDNDRLFNSFGYVFDFRQKSSEEYKRILGYMTKLYSDGPTVKSLTGICAALIGVTPIVEAEEVIQEAFDDGNRLILVTDKHAYSYDNKYSFNSLVKTGSVINKGAKLHAGDVPVDAIEYYDNVSLSGWWTKKLGSLVGFSRNLFQGSYKFQLFFKNDLDILTVDLDGNVLFPVYGDSDDVTEFNNNIDSQALITGLNNTYNLNLNPGSSYTFNPVDFIFRNFIKNNAGLLKFGDLDEDQIVSVCNFLKFIDKLLPPYTYFIFDTSFNVNQALYDVAEYGDDGADPDTGDVPYKNDLFSLGVTPELDQLEVAVDNEDVSSPDAVCTIGTESARLTKHGSVVKLDLLSFS